MEKYKEYAVGMQASDEVLEWIDTVLKARFKKHNPSTTEVEHILDFLVSNKAPKRLRRMSYKDAKRKAKEWSEANQKKGRHLKDTADDIEPVHEFEDGSRIVKLLSQKAYKREGHLMRHCVGGYDVKDNIVIYSYRDAKNEPHATFELRKEDNEIVQIKGKGNGDIHPKYINPIITFLETVGMDIRPNDMINLGYVLVPKEHLPFARTAAKPEELYVLRGETYALR